MDSMNFSISIKVVSDKVGIPVVNTTIHASAQSPQAMMLRFMDFAAELPDAIAKSND